MTRRRHTQAFTIVSVLVLATVLFALLSLALSAGYALHRQNRHVLHAVQARCETFP